jgi:hypothetical protein
MQPITLEIAHTPGLQRWQHSCNDLPMSQLFAREW